MTAISLLRSPEAADNLFRTFVEKRPKPFIMRSPVVVTEDIRRQEQVLLRLHQELEYTQSLDNQSYIQTAVSNFSLAREELLKHPHVVDAFISGVNLFVQFKDIEGYAAALKSTFDFGSFLVGIDMQHSIVRIYSLKYFIIPRLRQDSYKADIKRLVSQGVYPSGYIGHPHVRNLNPCLGNIAGLLSPLLAQYQYGTAIELISAYLQSANMDDCWGVMAGAWPLLKGPGIQKWSAKTYPRISEARWRRCVSSSGHPDNESQWTNKTHVVLECDSEELLKCIIELPQDRQTEPTVTEGIESLPRVYCDEEGYLMQEQASPDAQKRTA